MAIFDRINRPEMSREEAEKLLASLVSDQSALQKELDLADEKSLTSASDSSKQQWLDFVADILDALDVFEGRGFSVFLDKPKFRMEWLNENDDPNRFRKAAKYVRAAADTFRKK